MAELADKVRQVEQLKAEKAKANRHSSKENVACVKTNKTVKTLT